MCYNFYVSQSMLNYDQKKDIINPKRCQPSVFKDWSRKILLSFPPTLLVGAKKIHDNINCHSCLVC